MSIENKKENNYPKLLRLRQVLQILPISKSSWYKGIKDGKYPTPLKLGKRTSCWFAHEIYELIENYKTQEI
ncbi:helix-turn-helix transcriptional regulator [Desulfonatronum thioautotrophicum]|uniref:helix-turn-helix transcriptional regulator n=1 Tax=Desulfonatronum thioautotrophicum TaxID=617001 RepID=UPI0009FD5AF1|nr:AlpA family phage regulatory protein [Desulfonatronum thioautotrophicum]